MKRLLVVLSVFMILHPGYAWSAPSGHDSQGPENVPLGIQPVMDPLPGERSEATALLLSLCATAIPAVLAAPAAFGEGGEGQGQTAALVFLGSLIVGPSVGHFYAGRPGRGLLGIGVRVVALFGIAGAVAMSWDEESSGGNAMAFASLGAGAGFLIWDIASAPRSARIHNRALRERHAALGIGRIGGTDAPGVVLTASF
jgi:hypothetical protein